MFREKMTSKSPQNPQNGDGDGDGGGTHDLADHAVVIRPLTSVKRGGEGVGEG